jgi:prepilin-type N-terminal cleavage/methylation domain-containing protein
MSRTSTGLSLIELMLVTALVAIISGISLPLVGAGMRRYAVIAAGQQVAGMLRSVRMQAVARNTTLNVHLDLARGTYQLVDEAGASPVTSHSIRGDGSRIPPPHPSRLSSVTAMHHTTRPSPSSRTDGSTFRSGRADNGFTLVEVLMSLLIGTIGLAGAAAVLAVATMQHVAARESTRSVRFATDRIDALMKLPFTSPSLAIGGDLDNSVEHYSSAPAEGIDLRWAVTAGPTEGTRRLTVRVVNRGGGADRRTELVTIVRQW